MGKALESSIFYIRVETEGRNDSDLASGIAFSRMLAFYTIIKNSVWDLPFQSLEALSTMDDIMNGEGNAQ